jgi:hypothetical protein
MNSFKQAVLWAVASPLISFIVLDVFDMHNVPVVGFVPYPGDWLSYWVILFLWCSDDWDRRRAFWKLG